MVWQGGTRSMLNSILWAVLGGAILGISASWMLLTLGRVTGVSGIVGSLFNDWSSESTWRVFFLLGLALGGMLLVIVLPESIQPPSGRSPILIALAGLLVGYGTLRGNGCTSGHGICGITRFSPRSLVATLSFMATGFLSATAVGFILGDL
ncbi:MAG: YeeE/YedE family protein [Deltaproteobacteria bacterium]|nr:YeeE/YedE family protein [Deltaproteobacteria bacterium]MBT6433486.1 YeeE/YedE family protein [Deltaproteobacteria bacterium]MBT6491592.1 YeeE/YedE family protein [Deltaproteobacteria bacterium]